MKIKTAREKLRLILSLIFVFSSLAGLSLSRQGALPVTGAGAASGIKANPYLWSAPLAAKAERAATVNVAGKFTLSVSQFGSSIPNDYTLGQYDWAARKGNIGLLAHNYLAGANFYTLEMGDVVTVTYENGTSKQYVVNNVLRFQASVPGDFNQPFLNTKGKEIPTHNVFNKAYKNGGVTFQTCIFAEGSSSWGLLFVQAVPKK